VRSTGELRFAVLRRDVVRDSAVARRAAKKPQRCEDERELAARGLLGAGKERTERSPAQREIVSGAAQLAEQRGSSDASLATVGNISG
jgi:hypothetical protein